MKSHTIINNHALTLEQQADYHNRVTEYTKRAQKIIDDHYAENLASLVSPRLDISHGPRYSKIVKVERAKNPDGSLRDIPGGSVHSFIDATNGDVLKPASYKAPAKHARGNIFDEHNGAGSLTSYGPAYLK